MTCARIANWQTGGIPYVSDAAPSIAGSAMVPRHLSEPHAQAQFARYSHEAEHDAVLILAIRHQREAGYAG